MKKYGFNLKLREDVAKKLAFVAKSEGMSVQNLLTSMVRQRIQYFERVKGNIKGVDLVNICEEFVFEE